MTRRRPVDARLSASLVDDGSRVRSGSQAGPRPAFRSTLLGVTVLALAAAMAVAVPHLISAPSGRAARAPLPAPPAVGSCLTSDSPGTAAGTDTGLAATPFADVPCEMAHQAEVVAAWQADDPLVTALSRFSGYLNRPGTEFDRTMGGVTDALVDACWHAVQAYVMPPQLTSQWYPVQPRVVPALLRAPIGAGWGRWRWLACVVVAGNGATWNGTLRWEPDQPLPRPAALTVACSPAGSTDVAPCDRPHRTEVLGWPDHSRAAIAADAARSCLAHAVSTTGRPDPTYGGRILIRLHERPTQPVGAPPLCVAELVGEGELIGSLVGIDDAALPVA